MRTPKIQNFAKENRQNLTKAEAIIWKHIKGAKIEGVKFRWQHIGNEKLHLGGILEYLGIKDFSEFYEIAFAPPSATK